MDQFVEQFRPQDIAENNTAISWQSVESNSWVYPGKKMSKQVWSESPHPQAAMATPKTAPMKNNIKGFTFLGEEGEEQTSLK